MARGGPVRPLHEPGGHSRVERQAARRPFRSTRCGGSSRAIPARGPIRAFLPGRRKRPLRLRGRAAVRAAAGAERAPLEPAGDRPLVPRCRHRLRCGRPPRLHRLDRLAGGGSAAPRRRVYERAEDLHHQIDCRTAPTPERARSSSRARPGRRTCIPTAQGRGRTDAGIHRRRRHLSGQHHAGLARRAAGTVRSVRALR